MGFSLFGRVPDERARSCVLQLVCCFGKLCKVLVALLLCNTIGNVPVKKT